jgi:hypothetical protein
MLLRRAFQRALDFDRPGHALADFAWRLAIGPTHRMGERRTAVEADAERDLADREIGCLQQLACIVEADTLLEFANRRAGTGAE